MVSAFQIVLLIVILVSFMGIVGEKDDKDLRSKMTATSIAGMAAFIITLFLF